jgi:hypothetical protein
LSKNAKKNGIFYIAIRSHGFYSCLLKNGYMKIPGFYCILIGFLCIAIAAAGCTSSKGPAAATSGSVTSAPAAQTTPACPDKLVWDGSWDSRYLGMAGNHDLSTAWTKYKDRAYGDEASAKMTQTCWDVEGTFTDKGIKCEATFKGSVVKNTLSGTWSASTMCGTKAENGKIFLTMAADNQSWLGDFYSAGQDPSLFPPNWAGRRNP